MESATSRSVRQYSSKPARKFPETFRGTANAAANFVPGDRQLRSQSSTRSTARICGVDAANKKGAAAADELFRQIGRRIRASQLPRKILVETECRRLPTLEKSPATPPRATNRATRCANYFSARPPVGPWHDAIETLQFLAAERHKR